MVKGAPEVILNLSSKIEGKEKRGAVEKEIQKAKKLLWNNKSKSFTEIAEQGRLVGFAQGKYEAQKESQKELLKLKEDYHNAIMRIGELSDELRRNKKEAEK